ncbi:hypothetical protein BDZ89DRAFT_1051924 [Hymenopellis radicata]|nr:hypothetical protein BDZ89DRAFT_1051924 [Hymenopellis radicata]
MAAKCCSPQGKKFRFDLPTDTRGSGGEVSKDEWGGLSQFLKDFIPPSYPPIGNSFFSFGQQDVARRGAKSSSSPWKRIKRDTPSDATTSSGVVSLPTRAQDLISGVSPPPEYTKPHRNRPRTRRARCRLAAGQKFVKFWFLHHVESAKLIVSFSAYLGLKMNRYRMALLEKRGRDPRRTHKATRLHPDLMKILDLDKSNYQFRGLKRMERGRRQQREASTSTPDCLVFITRANLAPCQLGLTQDDKVSPRKCSDKANNREKASSPHLDRDSDLDLRELITKSAVSAEHAPRAASTEGYDLPGTLLNVALRISHAQRSVQSDINTTPPMNHRVHPRFYAVRSGANRRLKWKFCATSARPCSKDGAIDLQGHLELGLHRPTRTLVGSTPEDIELILVDFGEEWCSKWGRLTGKGGNDANPDLVEFPEPGIRERKKSLTTGLGPPFTSPNPHKMTATPYSTSRTKQMCPSWRVVRFKIVIYPVFFVLTGGGVWKAGDEVGVEVGRDEVDGRVLGALRASSW